MPHWGAPGLTCQGSSQVQYLVSPENLSERKIESARTVFLGTERIVSLGHAASGASLTP